MPNLSILGSSLLFDRVFCQYAWVMKQLLFLLFYSSFQRDITIGGSQ